MPHPTRLLRRLFLFAALACLLTGPAQADTPPAFDRAAAGARYRAWEARFENDLRVYAKERAAGKAAAPKDVERIFAHSLAPGSRAISNVQQLFSGTTADYTQSGEIIFVGPRVLLLKMLKNSYPAGQGGAFPEPPGSTFPPGLTVWYMHIQSGDLLEERYFSNPAIFKPYHLPPNGTLERDAYPFLLFEDKNGELRLGGFGREYWGALETLWNVQFF